MLSRRKLNKLMEYVNRLVFVLSDQETKLRHAIRKMREEEMYYLGLCKEAVLKKEKLKMKMYACHVASIRWAIMLLKRVEARVTGLKIRLSTCQRIVKTWLVIGPDMEKVREEAGPLLEIMPWLKRSVETLCYEIDAFLEATQFEAMDMPEEPPIGRDMPVKILEEVMKEIEDKLEEALPSPPEEPVPQVAGENEPVLVAIEESSPEPSRDIEELARNLMDYIVRNGRRLNLRRCAAELGASEEDIRDALKWLCEKGMIKIRGPGYGVREGP